MIQQHEKAYQKQDAVFVGAKRVLGSKIAKVCTITTVDDMTRNASVPNTIVALCRILLLLCFRSTSTIMKNWLVTVRCRRDKQRGEAWHDEHAAQAERNLSIDDSYARTSSYLYLPGIYTAVAP